MGHPENQGEVAGPKRLLLCPFCNQDVEEPLSIALETNPQPPFETKYAMACKNCGASGPGGDSAEEAVLLWNVRGYDT